MHHPGTTLLLCLLALPAFGGETAPCLVLPIPPRAPAAPLILFDGSTSAAPYWRRWLTAACDTFGDEIRVQVFSQLPGGFYTSEPLPEPCAPDAVERIAVRGSYTPLQAAIDDAAMQAAGQPTLLLTDGVDCRPPTGDGYCAPFEPIDTRGLALFGTRDAAARCSPSAHQCVDIQPIPHLSIGDLERPSGGSSVSYIDVGFVQEDVDSVVALLAAGSTTCTGTLVRNDVVLTAAHCLPVQHAVLSADARSVASTVSVAEAIAHPGGLDVALLRLAKPIDARPFPRRTDRSSDGPAGRLAAVGFGARSSDAASNGHTRQTIDLVAQGWGCDGERVSALGCLPGFEMVVPPQGGADTCNGDSGGPLLEVVPAPAGHSAACQRRLVAITSRSLRGQRCGGGGIYTRVDRLTPWIETTLERWSPTCCS